jgi:hypothetical protein
MCGTTGIGSTRDLDEPSGAEVVLAVSVAVVGGGGFGLVAMRSS